MTSLLRDDFSRGGAENRIRDNAASSFDIAQRDFLFKDCGRFADKAEGCKSGYISRSMMKRGMLNRAWR